MNLYYAKKWRSQIVIFSLCLLALTSASYAQTVSGRVMSQEENGPLINATVLVEGTQRGTFTDENGAFEIQAGPKDAIIISYVGYATQVIPVNGRTQIEVLMNQKFLNEVIVVGYGTTRKSDLTGAVSTVSADELTQLATPDVLQALQGRAAGVNIVSQSGAPGAGVRIRIRGVGSINNSDPLYVVDGFQTNDISFLNPNDIQSIEVLKDASATAIYGSRGANGVVLISTRRGGPENAGIQITAYAANQQVWRTLDLLNATEFAQLRLEAYANDGITPGNPETSIESNVLEYAAAGNYQGTDWQNEILRTGFMQNATISISGGNTKNKYSVSGTFFDEEGTIKNTEMRKIFLRLNADNQLNSWLSMKTSAFYTHVDQTFYNNDYFNGMLPLAIRTNPIRPSYDNDLDNWGTLGIPQEGSNAARIVDENRNNRGNTNKIVGNISLNAQITKGLVFRSLAAADISFFKNRSFLPAFFISNEEQRDLSQLREFTQQNFRYQWSNFLTFDQDFGLSNLSVMAGQEIQASNFANVSVTGFDLPDDPNQYFLSAARSTDFVVTSRQEQEALASFFGRVNYGYDGKYLLTVNLRYDGSSRFTPENRWGFFPAFSAGWNMGREAFMDGIDFVRDLKLRGGWGRVGNQNAARNYGYVTTVVGNQLYVLNGEEVQGFIPTTLSNPDLIWETSTMTNIGIDASLINDRIQLTADYFIRQTSDMIVDGQLPRFAGAFPPKVNAGNMENRGLEFLIAYRNYENAFTYDFGLNFTRILNTVTELGDVPFIDGGSAARAGNTTRTEVGQSIASFYGLETNGIFQSQEAVNAYVGSDGELIQPNAQAGDVIFVDQNGDGTIDGEDRIYLGSGFADFSYGFNTTLGYKNFDFNLFLQGTYGNEIINALYQPFHDALGYNNSTRERLNRWTPDNPSLTEPRVTISDPNDNDRFSDLYIEDGTYLRVKNVQFGYTLPASVLGGTRSARVYVAADNLLTFTNYTGLDPEVGELSAGNPFAFGVDVANYPQPRRMRVGIDLRF